MNLEECLVSQSDIEFLFSVTYSYLQTSQFIDTVLDKPGCSCTPNTILQPWAMPIFQRIAMNFEFLLYSQILFLEWHQKYEKFENEPKDEIIKKKSRHDSGLNFLWFLVYLPGTHVWDNLLSITNQGCILKVLFARILLNKYLWFNKSSII